MRRLQDPDNYRDSWPDGQRVIPRLKEDYIIVQRMKTGGPERVLGSNSLNHYHHAKRAIKRQQCFGIERDSPTNPNEY